MNEQYWLYNESCMDAMKKMEDDSVDLVLTDPPYNLGLFMKNMSCLYIECKRWCLAIMPFTK